MRTHFPDSIICYYWLPESDLTNIFTAQHKWWFSHCMLFRTIIFFGPQIKTDRSFVSGPFRIFIFSSTWDIASIHSYLLNKQISFNPLLSFVIEKGLDLSPLSETPPQLFKYAIVGDTHHLSNPISSSLFILENLV